MLWIIPGSIAPHVAIRADASLLESHSRKNVHFRVSVFHQGAFFIWEAEQNKGVHFKAQGNSLI